jgi:hypothetical protein
LTWSYQGTRESYAEKYAQLRAPLEQIATLHPEYGCRRVAAELREALGHPDQPINGKVVPRLHHLWDLPLRRSTRFPVCLVSGMQLFKEVGLVLLPTAWLSVGGAVYMALVGFGFGRVVRAMIRRFFG